VSGGTSSVVGREILRSNLRAIADDMSVALEHNSPSPAVSEARDYAVAFTSAAGEVVVADNAVHVPSLAMTARAILDFFEFNLRPGDLVVTNDPYSGGTHTQDLTVFAPVYAHGELVGGLLTRVRVPDFGGQVAGGCNPSALELWAEGVRLRPVKLARSGRIDKDVHQTVLLNTRLPAEVDGLLDAMRSSLDLGQQRVARLVSRHGVERLAEGMEYALAYSNLAARAALRGWPSATFEGEARVPHDCTGRAPVVRARLTAHDGELTIDLSGSDAQSASFVNSAWGSTCGSALLPVAALLGPDVPIDSGLLRAIHFRGADGTIVRPAYPAAVGWGPMHPGREIVNAVSAAIARATGVRLPAVAPQALATCCFAGYRILAVDGLVFAGAGGANGGSGWGPAGYFARRRLLSVERSEMAFPEILVRALELTGPSPPPQAGVGAPGVELAVALRASARITAWVAAAEGAAAGDHGGPRFAIAGEDGRTAAHTVCVDRRVAPGVLTLRTAAGPPTIPGGAT